MSNLLFFTISAQLLLAGVEAQNRFCNQVRHTNRYNASIETTIPALSLNNTTLVASNDQKWEISAKMVSTTMGAGMSSAVTSYFVDTVDSDASNIGVCLESAQAWDNGFYLFSKKVLSRASKGKAGDDCKGMLGEHCVEALKRHLQRNALQYMEKGACPTIDPEEPSNIIWNQTVPYECSDFVGGDDAWNKNLFADKGNLKQTISQIFEDQHCTIDAGELQQNIHPLGIVAGEYNQSIRFAFPTFMTFFPNLTAIQSSNSNSNSSTSSANANFTGSIDDVHVEVMCLIPDNMQEGSIEPPTAEELLKGQMKFGSNVTDPEGAEEPDVSALPPSSSSGTPSATESTGGVGPVRTAAPMLGAIGVAAMLLV